MKEMLLRPDTTAKICSPREVFFCPEESQFYSYCLESLVIKNCDAKSKVVEFGCGDGSPVISALLRTPFNGLIYGYELNSAACELANSRIQQYNLETQYVIHNQSFFAAAAKTDYLIANPPYLPAPDNDILMPLLHGGSDGSVLTRRLLSLGYDRALLMLSSYANPVETIQYAIAQGYAVANFMVVPLSFGYYSSEPKVENSILELRQNSKAFYSDSIYFLAGVLFQQQSTVLTDLSLELIQVMTAL